ncbi:hypothetical protein WMY93_024925 [Mugilogobius chulae]|uniref:3CxxC-type domain-containing protein n=1 Tax=Mugilogobius chulae TaxID=88201 RepID=A0AAW0N5U2_9GOBI
MERWREIFETEIEEYTDDRWYLHFDDNIKPKKPDHGREKYITKTFGWFTCRKCKRQWPSNYVTVVFHFRLNKKDQGHVKVRRLKQNCKYCKNAPMEKPRIDTEHIEILMENLVKKIREKCYQENVPKSDKRHLVKSESPHEPDHCEGCKAGISPCSAASVNCSEPTQQALLTALDGVFELSSVRPVNSLRTPTNVSMHFTMYGILGVDEKAQLLMTYLWLTFWWDNEFVSWDPDECGTSIIALPRKKFWVPDIVINEFMDENKAPFVPYVYLFNDGQINDALPVKVVSSCNLDIYTFPFDIQNCTLTFNSYLHRVKDIRMVLGKSVEEITQMSKEVMTTMGEWELIDITFHDSSTHDENSIDELAFHVRVRRRATLYVVNLIIPSCFLITVDLFSFLLPPQSVDRSSFKMTLILGYTVFLLIMNDLLPITGNTIPLINVFFSLCLALMVASLLETILITDLLHSSTRLSPVPRWVVSCAANVWLPCLPAVEAKEIKQYRCSSNFKGV